MILKEVVIVKELVSFLPTQAFCFALLKMQWKGRRGRIVYRETIRSKMFSKF